MKRFSDKHSMHTLNELNVTPLLDLAFVLLLIFMITTPLMENSTDLILPTGRQDGAEVNPGDVIQVSLFKDDRLLVSTQVGSEPVPLGDLTARLVALHAAKPDAAVVVRTHKELTVQRQMEVLDAVKAAKITKVGLAKITEGQ
jgi:biopolymer transport protein ExbD